MNPLPDSWLARAVWLALAVSTIWALFVFGSHYSSCRAWGGQVLCVVVALFFSWLEVLLALIETLVRLIVLVMP